MLIPKDDAGIARLLEAVFRGTGSRFAMTHPSGRVPVNSIPPRQDHYDEYKTDPEFRKKVRTAKKGAYRIR